MYAKPRDFEGSEHQQRTGAGGGVEDGAAACTRRQRARSQVLGGGKCARAAAPTSPRQWSVWTKDLGARRPGSGPEAAGAQAWLVRRRVSGARAHGTVSWHAQLQRSALDPKLREEEEVFAALQQAATGRNVLLVIYHMTQRRESVGA